HLRVRDHDGRHHRDGGSAVRPPLVDHRGQRGLKAAYVSGELPPRSTVVREDGQKLGVLPFSLNATFTDQRKSPRRCAPPRPKPAPR
ncbi:hypothetical protein, partial [Amycolatopsis sp. NPDC051128]|uniref:hypothetical protein n=1 Tax=Amycolatopsis sp. NPDC051128 TaxID=3155412 RepID=UPI0034241912